MTWTQKRLLILAVISVAAFILGQLAVRVGMNLLPGRDPVRRKFLMSKTAKAKEVKVMPVWMGVLVFALAFGAGAVSKFAIQSGWTKEYSVPWSDELETHMVDLPYGEGEANKLDLYLPKDDTRETYGLAVYFHTGGFTSGDKSGDLKMLSWLCKKSYVAAGVNYALRNEAHPEASVLSQSLEIKAAVPRVIAAVEETMYPIGKMTIAKGSAGHALSMIYAYRDAGEAPVPVTLWRGRAVLLPPGGLGQLWL